MEKIPDIKPIKLKEYNVKQSKYAMVGRVPIRQIFWDHQGLVKAFIFKTKYWIFTKSFC